jgi:hypothetical protein
MDSYEEFHQAATKTIEKQRGTGIQNSRASWRYSTVGEFLQMTIVANLAEDFVFAFNDPTSSKGLCTESGDHATKDTHLPVSAAMVESSSSCQFCKLPKGFRKPAQSPSQWESQEDNSKLPTLCLTANKQTSKQTSTFSSTDKTQVP